MSTVVTPNVTPNVTPTSVMSPTPTFAEFDMRKWVIIGVLVVVCCAGVGVGLWFMFFRGSGPAGPPKKACAPGDQSKSEYTRRVESGGDWVCPPGYTDTGCSWDDGDLGEFQCRRPRTTKCSPGDESKSKYTRRVQSGSNWVCPSGFTDTGCGWNDTGKGELQCRKPK